MSKGRYALETGPGLFVYLSDVWSITPTIEDICQTNGVFLSSEEIGRLDKLNSI